MLPQYQRRLMNGFEEDRQILKPVSGLKWGIMLESSAFNATMEKGMPQISGFSPIRP